MLRQFAGGQQHRSARVGEISQQPVDLGLGSHIDAERRLLEHQQPGADLDPAGQHHLLLVAAGESR